MIGAGVGVLLLLGLTTGCGSSGGSDASTSGSEGATATESRDQADQASDDDGTAAAPDGDEGGSGTSEGATCTNPEMGERPEANGTDTSAIDASIQWAADAIYLGDAACFASFYTLDCQASSADQIAQTAASNAGTQFIVDNSSEGEYEFDDDVSPSSVQVQNHYTNGDQDPWTLVLQDGYWYAASC